MTKALTLVVFAYLRVFDNCSGTAGFLWPVICIACVSGMLQSRSFWHKCFLTLVLVIRMYGKSGKWALKAIVFNNPFSLFTPIGWLKNQRSFSVGIDYWLLLLGKKGCHFDS